MVAHEIPSSKNIKYTVVQQTPKLKTYALKDIPRFGYYKVVKNEYPFPKVGEIGLAHYDCMNKVCFTLLDTCVTWDNQELVVTPVEDAIIVNQDI